MAATLTLAIVIGADGEKVGRYDKIHLVPFGEYVPFANLLSFAHKLTGRVSKFTRGTNRKYFRLGGQRYGIFICYEAVFADEVRAVCAAGGRGAGEHQRRWLVRGHERGVATPEHGAYAGDRKSAVDFSRHEQRRDMRDRSLWRGAAEYCATRGGCAAGSVRVSGRCDVLYGARGYVWVGVCGARNGVGRLGATRQSQSLSPRQALRGQGRLPGRAAPIPVIRAGP